MGRKPNSWEISGGDNYIKISTLAANMRPDSATGLPGGRVLG